MKSAYKKRKNSPIGLSADIYLEPFRGELISRREYAETVADHIRGKKCSLSAAAVEYEYFGLHKKSGYWIFREYAPNASEVTLAGDFSGWQLCEEYKLTPECGNGVWSGRFPAEKLCHGMHYKMYVKFPGGEGWRIPAFARYVCQDPVTKLFSAVVWEPENPYEFKYPVPQFSSPLIYEAHPGMAQEEAKIGSYREFADRILPEIAKKGYNFVQLMAVMEHPYYGSFGYHVSNFFAVSSRFGTPEEFKYLVDQAHRCGLRVIIDAVHSHAVKNIFEGLAEIDGCRSTYFHSGKRGEHEAWDSLCFDYSKEHVLRFLLSNCRFFLEEYHIDGFRFDGVTSMLYRHHGLNRSFVSYGDYFGPETDIDALTYLTLANRVIHELRPDAVTIAEDVSGMPGLASPEGVGFDYRMAMGVTDMWFKLLDIPDEQWDMYYLFGELTNARQDEKSISYAECHDQAIVGGQSAFFRMAGAEIYSNMHKNSCNTAIDRAVALHKMMRLASAAAAGYGYLNFMGNEFGHPEWIDMPREGNNWSMEHARRQWSLEKDESLRFRELSLFDREILKIAGSSDFYGACVQCVRIDNQAKVICFERNGYWFIFNFHPSNSYENFEIEVLRGSYRTYLDSDSIKFGGYSRRIPDQEYFSLERDFGEVISLYLPCRTVLVLKRT